MPFYHNNFTDIIICKGLPGSGKTTWAKQFCEDHTDYVRVNRDELRAMRGLYWIPGDEAMITKWEQSCIREAVLYGKNVIIDATNFNKRFLNDLKYVIVDAFYKRRREEIFNSIKSFKFFEAYKAAFKQLYFTEQFFDLPLEVCIERDRARDGVPGKRMVGEKVIRGFHKKYFEKHYESIYNKSENICS